MRADELLPLSFLRHCLLIMFIKLLDIFIFSWSLSDFYRNECYINSSIVALLVGSSSSAFVMKSFISWSIIFSKSFYFPPLFIILQRYLKALGPDKSEEIISSTASPIQYTSNLKVIYSFFKMSLITSSEYSKNTMN